VYPPEKFQLDTSGIGNIAPRKSAPLDCKQIKSLLSILKIHETRLAFLCQSQVKQIVADRWPQEVVVVQDQFKNKFVLWLRVKFILALWKTKIFSSSCSPKFAFQHLPYDTVQNSLSMLIQSGNLCRIIKDEGVYLNSIIPFAIFTMITASKYTNLPATHSEVVCFVQQCRNINEEIWKDKKKLTKIHEKFNSLILKFGEEPQTKKHQKPFKKLASLKGPKKHERLKDKTMKL
jgi:hypothetical protein